MRHNQLIGHEGENRAVDYLIRNGYEILCRNFRCREGEVDIIAKDKKVNEIVFIEVKTRTTLKFGMPHEAVNQIKQKHICEVSNYYIYKNNLEYYKTRFDIIEVYFFRNNNKKRVYIRQIKNCEFTF